jgi:DNA polymerase III epsilon subunit family exonuclease
MGLFDFLKKKPMTTQLPIETKSLPKSINPGKAVAEKIEIDGSKVELLRKTFISFDVETTGLSPTIDRIVEIGAMLFIDSVPVKSFRTLINPNVNISASASAINHITNAMLVSAPIEQDVYPQFIEFLGEALNENIIMCAHNARFDFDFLCNTLSRLGYDANIRYVDTLSLSRKYIKGLENYKQGTVANAFGLVNDAAHRAVSDAEICGRILCGILNRVDDALAEEKKQIEQAAPAKEELEVCAYIQNIIEKNGRDISWLRYSRNSNNYVDVTCLYTFLKFKFSKKGKYVIVRNNIASGIDMPTEPCTISEDGTIYIRVYFNSPFDLEPLSGYIISVYRDCYTSMQEYIGMGNYALCKAEQSIRMLRSISRAEMETLLLDAVNREYDSATATVQVEQSISREDVVVNAIHSRVPFSEIRNLGNWEKGFDKGHPYWERGEMARKVGRIEEAISLLDKARHNGYDAPALYESYAKAYRRIKDYDNEIVILEEGIARKSSSEGGALEARRDTAIKLLFVQQESERKAQEKAQEKAQTKEQTTQKAKGKETVASMPKHPLGRTIIQMTDDGTVIKVFETINSAVKEIGISSKSIRDAANGVQKHAGGYCWKYKE